MNKFKLSKCKKYNVTCLHKDIINIKNLRPIQKHLINSNLLFLSSNKQTSQLKKYIKLKIYFLIFFLNPMKCNNSLEPSTVAFSVKQLLGTCSSGV